MLKWVTLLHKYKLCKICPAVNLSFQHSVLYLDEGESADDDDPNAAEHDAQKIE